MALDQADKDWILANVSRTVIVASSLGGQKYATNGLHKRTVTSTQAAELVFMHAAVWNNGDPFLLSSASINAIAPA